MTISFINQENREITKIDWRIDLYETQGKLMTAEFRSAAFLLRLN